MKKTFMSGALAGPGLSRSRLHRDCCITVHTAAAPTHSTAPPKSIPTPEEKLMIGYLRLPLSRIAHSDRVGIPLMRVAIAIVFLWIGALKFAPYEADSITPFVANSPFMLYFYEHPTEYKAHLTHEGELKPAERAWQTANNTYGFSDGLGTMEIMSGVVALLGVFARRWGIVGATLSFLTPFVTLSFLITTPEAWVP